MMEALCVHSGIHFVDTRAVACPEDTFSLYSENLRHFLIQSGGQSLPRCLLCGQLVVLPCQPLHHLTCASDVSAATEQAEADAGTLSKEIAQLDEDISVWEGDKKAATEVAGLAAFVCVQRSR